MSKVKCFLEVENPPYRQVHEEFEIDDMQCNCCHGNGFVIGWGDTPKRVCPKCEGRGVMTARIVIDWL